MGLMTSGVGLCSKRTSRPMLARRRGPPAARPPPTPMQCPSLATRYCCLDHLRNCIDAVEILFLAVSAAAIILSIDRVMLTNSRCVWQAGNWTTPPGPATPVMAGFTPITEAASPSGSPSGSPSPSGSSGSSSASPPSPSPPPPSPSPPPPSPSNTAG